MALTKEQASLRARQWYAANKEKVANRHLHDKEQFLEHRRELYKKNREKIRARDKVRYWKNRDQRVEYSRNYYRKNAGAGRQETLRRQNESIDSWRGMIPEMVQCQCCGRDIFFNSRDGKTTIHFDHRHGGDGAIARPAAWLRTHPCTSANKMLWDPCDFGMLCIQCNTSLPTVDRKLFLRNAVKYVGGI